jgi:hypothetical protein
LRDEARTQNHLFSQEFRVTLFTDWLQFAQNQLRLTPSGWQRPSLAELERYLLVRVLRFTCGNQAEASRLLGLSRQLLRLKMLYRGLPSSRDYWSATDSCADTLDQPYAAAPRYHNRMTIYFQPE